MHHVTLPIYETSISLTQEETTEAVVQDMKSQGVEVDWTLWCTLWVSFGITCIFVAIQVFGKNTTTASPSVTSTPSSSNLHRTGSGRDVEHGRTDTSGGASSGDTTRQLFHKLLLVALLSRFLLLPIQLWDSIPSWWQFFADTLPIMAFASAWVLIVSFFVQLVETATGVASESTNNNTIVMQVVAYVMYALLMITYIWNDAAILLMYALLSCIHAALFATLIYFGPKLVSLLKPSLVRRSGLAIRLVSCGVVCLFVFAGRTIELSRKVLLFKQSEPSWWFTYGVLELAPAVALLIMMKKQSNRGSPSAPLGATPSPPATSTGALHPSPVEKTTVTSSLPPLKSTYSKPSQSKTTTSTTETSSLLRTSNKSGTSYGTTKTSNTNIATTTLDQSKTTISPTN